MTSARVVDADPARARRTGALLRSFAPQLGLRPDALRVHVDAGRTRPRAARGLAAGGAVYLDPGRYRPDTAAGRGVLAHELAHVAQRAETRLRPDRPAPSRAAAEAEAARAGADAAAGRELRRPGAVLPPSAIAADTGAEPPAADGLERYHRWRAELGSLADQARDTHAAELAAIADRLAGTHLANADVEAALGVLEPLWLETAAAVVHALGRLRLALVDGLAPRHRRGFRGQVLAAYAGLEPDELGAYDERLFDGLSLAGLDSAERFLAVVVLLDLRADVLAALLADRRHGDDVRRLIKTTGAPAPVSEPPLLATADDPILAAAEGAITRASARAIYADLLALPDPARRRALVRALDARGRLDAVLERLPREILFSTVSQLGVGRLLADREESQLVRHVRALMSRGVVDWSVNSREAYLTVLMLRELPLATREQLALLDPASAQLGERLSEAAGLHMLSSAAAAAQREQLHARLEDDRLWTAERAGELDTLIHMATILGAQEDVFALSYTHRDLLAGLEDLVERHGLYDEAAGRTRFAPTRLRRARPGEALGALRAVGVATGGLAVLAGGQIFVDVSEEQEVGARGLPLRATQRALGTVAHGVQLSDTGGANRAVFGWDGHNLTLEVADLGLDSVVRAGPGWSLHAGAVHATGVSVAATFPGADFSEVSAATVAFESLTVDHVVAEWQGRLVGAAQLTLTGLTVTGDVGVEPPRSPIRVPLLDRALEIMAAGLYAVSIGAVTGPRAIAAELVQAASRLRGLRVDLVSATFSGASLGAAEQVTTIEIGELHAAWAGTRAEYLKALGVEPRAAAGPGGAVIDVGSITVRGATGLVDLPPLTVEGIHAQGASAALTVQDLSDADLVGRFLAQGPGPAPAIAASEIEATAERITIELGEGAPPLTVGPLVLASGAFTYDPETGRVAFSGAEAAARDARLGALDVGRLAARGFRGTAELLEDGTGLRLSGVHIAWLTLRELDWTADNGATLNGAGPIHLLDVDLWATLSLDPDGTVQIAAERLDILSVEAEQARYRKGGVELGITAPFEIRNVRLHDVRWRPLAGMPTAAGTLGGLEGDVAGSLFSLALGGRLDTAAIEFELTDDGLSFQTAEAAVQGARLGPLEAGDVAVRGIRATVAEVEGGLQFRDMFLAALTLERIAWTAADGTSVTGPGPVELFHVRLTATLSLGPDGVPLITADPFSAELVEGTGLRYRSRGVDARTTGPLDALFVRMHGVRWQPTAGLPSATGTVGPANAAFAATLFGLAADGRAHADSIEVALAPGASRLRARGVETDINASWQKQLAELKASGVDTGTVLLTPQGITVGSERHPLVADNVRLRKLVFSGGGLTVTVAGADGLTLAGLRLRATVELGGETAVGLRISELSFADLGAQSLRIDGTGWSVDITAPAALKAIFGVVRDLVAQPTGDTWEAVSHGEVRIARVDATDAAVTISDPPALIGRPPPLASVPSLLRPYEPVVEHLNGHVHADVDLPIRHRWSGGRIDQLGSRFFPIDLDVDDGQIDLMQLDPELFPEFLTHVTDFAIRGNQLVLNVTTIGSVVEFNLSPAQASRLAQQLSQAGVRGAAPARVPLIALADPQNITPIAQFDLPNLRLRNIAATLSLTNPTPLLLQLGTLGAVTLEPPGLTDLVLAGDVPATGLGQLTVAVAELRFEAVKDLVLAPLPPISTGRMVMTGFRDGTIQFVDGWPTRLSGVVGVLAVDDVTVAP